MSEDKDSLWPYIGYQQALQDGTTHRTLFNESIARSIKPGTGKPAPLEDPLARHKAIPLHCRLLYTSMHQIIEDSFLKHYATIERLSHDRCDNYVSIEQFNDPGETLDYIQRSPVLKQSGVRIAYTDLPGIFFWDLQWQGEFISFGPHVDEAQFMNILTRIFEEIRYDPTIAAVRRAKIHV